MRQVRSIVLLLALASCKSGDSDATKIETTKLIVKKFSFDAYPRWVISHPDKECPASLEDLLDHMGSATTTTTDAWGTNYKWYCGGRADLPAGVKNFAVQSAGPDKQLDTNDDIKSWHGGASQ